MRRQRPLGSALLLALLVLAGCGEDEPADTGSNRCLELREQFDEALRDPANRACQSDQQCLVAGGVSSCSCEAHLSDTCGGRAVTAPLRPAIRDILDAFDEVVDTEECGEFSGTCDCLPLEAACLDGFCVTVSNGSCVF